MRLEYQIVAAVVLDLLVGDPQWLPHPVRLIGWCASLTERVTRRVVPWTRGAGILTTLVIVGGSGAIAYGLIALATHLHPYAGDAVSILVIYTTVAARDLAKHSSAVCRALAAEDLPEARKRVSWIVGRDTAKLDEPEIVRAAVESVAESFVDGVTAPLFFAVIAGPVGAIAYRASNTLDSMFGHKDERYLYFGWASARLDDVANFLPARLSTPFIALAALVLGARPLGSLKILWRDARNHDSPNAGFPEAAMAGALGVQLGGTNYYDGEPSEKPRIGDPAAPLSREHIRKANALMFVGCWLFLAAALGVRVLAVQQWASWYPS